MIVSQFKFKPDRPKYAVNTDTLDISHKKKINSFSDKEKKLEKMKKKLLNLKQKMINLDNNVSTIDDYPSKKSVLSQQILDLKLEIDQAENYTDELEYLSKVHDVVFDYYSLYDNQDDKQQYSHQAIKLSMTNKDSENQENIEEGQDQDREKENDINSENTSLNKRKNEATNKTESDEKRKPRKIKKNVSISDFAENNKNDKNDKSDNNNDEIDDDNVLENINDDDENSEDSELEGIIAKSFDKLSKLNKSSHKKRKEKKETKKRIKVGTKVNMNKKDIFSYIDPNNEIQKNSNNSKASYFRQYDILLNGTSSDKTMSRMCEVCNVEEQMIYNEGIYVCPVCAKTDNCIIESEITNYKDPMVEKTTFPYDRKNHFREWVSQLQAKESKEIPKDVFDLIKCELKKYRKKKLCYTEIEYMKGILKKLKLSAYYDHVFYIISVINKEPPPNIDRETEETLYKMFDLIQDPFERHCPKNRINFISYGFILNRFFQLIGKPEYMRYFPLLKSRTKQRQQDLIWRSICKDLGWKYYPSG
jgi:hypothetical protein